VSSVQMWITHK